MKPRVYLYEKCSTCRNALKFLQANKIAFELIPIKENPPTLAELKKMAEYVGGTRKLFNTSGLSYRALNLKDREISDSEAFALLAKDGMLVKRPFVLTSKGGAVGFKEETWKKLF